MELPPQDMMRLLENMRRTHNPECKMQLWLRSFFGKELDQVDDDINNIQAIFEDATSIMDYIFESTVFSHNGRINWKILHEKMQDCLVESATT
jgi:hypothetical protein